MLNGSVFGQRFYAARNPPWTAKKPTMSLRANGQIKGTLGHGDQKYVRKAFAMTAIKNYPHGRGFAMMNGKMTPKSAFLMQQDLKAAFAAYPQIAVGIDARKQKMRAQAEASHRASVARWQGGSQQEFLPGGAFEGGFEQY